MKNLVLCIVAILLMTACGNKSDKAINSSDTNAVNVDDGKHNEAYIKQRIDSIYSHFGYHPFDIDTPVEDAYNITYDSLYCTDSYQTLKAQADQISEETGYIWIDADHWIAGQDISEDWSYSIKKVEIVTDSTATVELNVHNFDDQKVILDLLFQRGDWYVDNFHFFYTDDEGKVNEIDEKEQARNFINEEKAKLEKTK